MRLPYRVQPNNTNKRTKKALNTNFNNDSYCKPDVKRPEMTSNDLNITQTNTKSKKKEQKCSKSLINAREY